MLFGCFPAGFSPKAETENRRFRKARTRRHFGGLACFFFRLKRADVHEKGELCSVLSDSVWLFSSGFALSGTQKTKIRERTKAAAFCPIQFGCSPGRLAHWGGGAKSKSAEKRTKRHFGKFASARWGPIYGVWGLGYGAAHPPKRVWGGAPPIMGRSSPNTGNPILRVGASAINRQTKKYEASCYRE